MEDCVGELKKIQTNFLQKYLEIVFINRYGEQWKEHAIRICSILYKHRKNELVSANNVILFNEPEMFSFSQLDFTSLKAICILGENPKQIKTELSNNGYNQIINNKVIRDRIKDINDDRSFESHLNYSESIEDITVQVYGAISNLEKLIDAIVKFEIKSNELDKFLFDAKKRVDIFKTSYSKQQIAIAAIMNDVNMIISEKVSFVEKWLEYYKRIKIDENGKDCFVIFNELACNKKIPEGIHHHAFNLYRGTFTKKDVLKAYEILDSNYDVLDDNGKALLASIYVNKNFEFYSEEKAKEILGSIKSKVTPVEDNKGNVMYYVNLNYSKITINK